MSRKNPLYPVAVDGPAGKLCVDKRCIRDVKWKILDNCYCDLHIVHPRQTKFTGFLEGSNGESRMERQRTQDAEGDAAQRADGDLRPREALLQIGRSEVERPREFVGTEQRPEAAPPEVRQAVGPGAVHEGQAGESAEEIDSFDHEADLSEEDYDPLEEFGSDEG